MKPLAILGLCMAVIGFSGVSTRGAETPPAQTAPVVKPVRVGTFDSRAVALAYYRKYLRSPEFAAQLKKLKEERDRAKAAGDNEKAKKLEAEGKAGQDQIHRQVFGSAGVDEVVAKIKDQLPDIASRAGVDLIVSKWSISYRSPGAKFVDVTEPMAGVFQPDEATWKMIREMSKRAPLSAEELRKHEHDKNF